jgi:hypothetical protein
MMESKRTLQKLGEVKCLQDTSDKIRGMEALVQNDLTKRYANDLYLYL